MYSYGSGFFFFLFFYSIAEYVDRFLELEVVPWLLSWSTGEVTERMLFPSVPSEKTVCCLTIPVV